mmetsp:Transcript_63835/g.138295  ORF Transcript_63835/g.138295 Transcript_63835/m.138295 type:complete len:102 (+) Transcript_63835:763-1068(+)
MSTTSFSMGKGTRFNFKKGNSNTTPGPGNYEPVVNQKNTPKHLIGKGKRIDFTGGSNGATLPGPGHYEQTNTAQKGQEYSFGSRTTYAKQFYEEPGPNHYV